MARRLKPATTSDQEAASLIKTPSTPSNGKKRALEDTAEIASPSRSSKRVKAAKAVVYVDEPSDVDGKSNEEDEQLQSARAKKSKDKQKRSVKSSDERHNLRDNPIIANVVIVEGYAASGVRKESASQTDANRATSIPIDHDEELPTPSKTKAASKSKGKSKIGPEVVRPDTVESAEKSGDKDSQASKAKLPRPRKTKEQKEAEAMPLAARDLASKVFVGAHVSAAGGVHKCVNNAMHIGGNAFALFLKSQRKWENPALKDEHRDSFKELCVTHKYESREHVVPHGSYLVNLAQKDNAKAVQAYDTFLDDLQRCEKLGIKLYNFHPGSTLGEPRQSAIARIADRLNSAHKATSTVVTLLENMAASSEANTLGGSFEDLRNIIALVEDKSRVGVCFDTCHGFAAGYDLRTPEAFKSTFDQFESIVGPQYLRAVHLNDSKAPFKSHRDLHYNIGYGFLGLRAFHNLVNDTRFHGIPLVLETPCDTINEAGKSVEDHGIWAREIKLLESLVGMDPGSEEFLTMEKDFWEKGTKERDRLQEVHDRKTSEKAAKAKKGKGKMAVDADDSDMSEVE